MQGAPDKPQTTIPAEQQHILAGLTITHLAREECFAELLEKAW
jgi:hypothetical protein